MVDGNTTDQTQLELDFPSPDDFESYDEVESDDGQAELPTDNFDESSADFENERCGCA
jgi:hypothetical protein